MNDMSVKIEQLLKLQKGVCEQYEKENKELLKTIKAQEEQIRLLKQLIENQDKIIMGKPFEYIGALQCE